MTLQCLYCRCCNCIKRPCHALHSYHCDQPGYWIDSMTNILVCPMKCWVHGSEINDCPKFLSSLPSLDDHAILVSDPNGCSPPFTILLSLDGITSYFEDQRPSLLEYEDKRIPKYHLTSKSPSWDPSTSLHSSQEDNMVDHRVHIIAKCFTDPQGSDMIASLVVSTAYRAINITDNYSFAAVWDQHVKVDMTTMVQTASLMTTQWKLTNDSDTLAWCCSILLHKAKMMLQHTTKWGVRNIANLTLA